MHRTVTARIEADVSAPALLALQVAVAGPPPPGERLTVTADGAPVPVREVPGGHGGRAHALDAPVGHLVVDYHARVDGAREVPHGGEADLLLYRRPSRYCPSDKLLATAASEFGGIDDDAKLVSAVTAWVRGRLVYTGGSSGPTDDAVDTLLLGAGVCRDYAHLVLSLLRARDVPARLAAAYAPGLDPMDFHAVVEAWVDGAWRVVDATSLAPRPSLLRIATGRDATDTAFLTSHHGGLMLTGLTVTATVDELPADVDPDRPVPLR